MRGIKIGPFLNSRREHGQIRCPLHIYILIANQV